MLSFNFTQNTIYSSIHLPLTLISLEKWSIIYISGLDSKKFLQNQLTIDINTLQIQQHQIAAYCTLKGKVYSTIIVFHYKEGYACIVRKSLSHLQIEMFKKYSVFLKVQIHELNNVFLLGLSGKNAKLFLSNELIDITDNSARVISNKGTTVLWFLKPNERFLLILSLKNFLLLKQKVNKQISLNNSKQWMLLDMEAGYPIIDKTMSQKFLPQAINLDILGALSFNKGCYYGQEIIAKVFYKNLNKYGLYLLVSQGEINPEIGSAIEINMLNKWFRVGFLLSIINSHPNIIWIQAVLKKPTNILNSFRIVGFKNIFLIKN